MGRRPNPPLDAASRRQLAALRLWRASHRIKQSHAAELLGVSQATISRWESGRLAPAPTELAALRRLLSSGSYPLAELRPACGGEGERGSRQAPGVEARPKSGDELVARLEGSRR